MLCYVDDTFQNSTLCLSYHMVALDTFNGDTVSAQCLLRKNRVSISFPHVDGLLRIASVTQLKELLLLLGSILNLGVSSLTETIF